jgi:hypothetical protein
MKTLKVAKKKSRPYYVQLQAQHGLQACNVYGKHGTVFKNDKSVSSCIILFLFERRTYLSLHFL